MKALLGLIPGWGQAASFGLSALSWIWNHKTLAALVLSLGLLAWYRHEGHSAQAAQHQAERDRDDARGRLADARHDAKRWHDASDQRDLAIGVLKASLDRQNAALMRLQFNLDHANEAAARAADADRTARAALDQRIQQLEDEAHAHPDQVAPLGGIVRGRVDRLWD